MISPDPRFLSHTKRAADTRASCRRLLRSSLTLASLAKIASSFPLLSPFLLVAAVKASLSHIHSQPLAACEHVPLWPESHISLGTCWDRELAISLLSCNSQGDSRSQEGGNCCPRSADPPEEGQRRCRCSESVNHLLLSSRRLSRASSLQTESYK